MGTSCHNARLQTAAAAVALQLTGLHVAGARGALHQAVICGRPHRPDAMRGRAWRIQAVSTVGHVGGQLTRRTALRLQVSWQPRLSHLQGREQVTDSHSEKGEQARQWTHADSEEQAITHGFSAPAGCIGDTASGTRVRACGSARRMRQTEQTLVFGLSACAWGRSVARARLSGHALSLHGECCVPVCECAADQERRHCGLGLALGAVDASRTDKRATAVLPRGRG